MLGQLENMLCGNYRLHIVLPFKGPSIPLSPVIMGFKSSVLLELMSPCIKSTWHFPLQSLKAKVGKQQFSSVTSGETEALGAHTTRGRQHEV